MSLAFSKEIESRNKQLSREQDKMLPHFDELMQAAQNLLKHTGDIFSIYGKNSHVPLNLQIQAGQLGEDGATIGVIANNYNIISSEIKRELSQFTSSAQQVFKSINDGRFLFCTAKIQREVIELFEKESLSDNNSQAEEMLYLENQQMAYMLKATEGLRSISEQTKKFQQDCKNMKMLTAGLEVTRVMGKVESSRLTATKGGLNELIADLESLQISISNSLREIEQMNRQIEHNMQKLLQVSQANN